MKKVKVVLDFVRFSVVEKIGFFRNVIVKMTGNRAFPNPTTSLEVVSGVVNDLEHAYVDAKDGAHTKIAIRDDKELLADEAFRKLANYVNQTASGDEAKLLSSGFNLSKEKYDYNKPVLQVKNGDVSGSIKVVARAIKGAGSYIWQYAKGTQPLNGQGWEIVGYSTQASFKLNNLDVASKYWFRVAGVTHKGVTDYCREVMKVIE